MSHCRVSGGPLVEVLDLGMQPLGNGFVSDNTSDNEYRYRLRCGFSEQSKLFQLFEQPDPSLMFNDSYAFLSSTSLGMRRHFRELAEMCVKNYMSGKPEGLVVEIGCNDGIFLENIAGYGLRHVGVEPSANVEQIASNKGLLTVQEFFSLEIARQIREQHGAANLIVATNVLCHISNLGGIANAVDELLSDDGILITEDPYLGSVLKMNSYDQIYDEHVFLFSALSMEYAFSKVGLELIDVEHQSVHGGSMRYVMARAGSREATARTRQLLDNERLEGLDRVETYHKFSQRVKESASELRQIIIEAKDAAGSVVAFGATSKSTTIYNYANIGPDLISKIFDNSPTKIGKFSPGMRIPIVSSALFPEDASGHAFLAAWNHEKEIRDQFPSFEKSGRRWIVHVPKAHYL